MIPLRVLMLDVITNGCLERSPATEDHTIEALGLQAAEPSFHERIEVRTLRWKQHDFGVGVLGEVVPHGPEADVPVHNQVTVVLQESILAVCQA
jgi:hypothetical protein